MINNRIDYSYIDKWEGNNTTGVVPSDNSGVTLLGFIDLKEKSRAFWQGMGLDEKFLDTLEPAYKKQGEDARQIASSISVDPENAVKMKAGTRKIYEDDLYKLWNSANPAEPWDDLGREQQTIMMSLFLNQGWLPKRTPNFWQETTSGDWATAIENLRNFYPKNPVMARMLGKRRNEEADLLEGWWSKKKPDVQPEPELPVINIIDKLQKVEIEKLSPAQIVELIDKVEKVNVEKLPVAEKVKQELLSADKYEIKKDLQSIVDQYVAPIFERNYPIDDDREALYNQYFRNADVTKFITQSPSFLQSMSASIEEASLSGNLGAMLLRKSFVPEEGFSSAVFEKTELGQKIIKGYRLDNESLDWIVERAGSPEHWVYLAEKVAVHQRNRELLQRDGWRGIGLQLGAWIIDPLNYNVYSRMGKGLEIIRNLNSADRYQNFLKSGMLVAGTEMGLFTPIAYEQPTLGLNDVLIAGALGGALGGGLNVLVAKSLHNVSKATQRLDIEEKGAELTARANDGEFGAINKANQQLQKEFADLENVYENIYDISTVGDKELAFKSARNVPVFGIPLMTKSGVAGNSKSPLMQRFANIFLTDPIGWLSTKIKGSKGDRMLAQTTVEDLRDQVLMTSNQIVYSQVWKNYKEWAKENGIWTWFRFTATDAKNLYFANVKRAIVALGRQGKFKLSPSEEALLADKSILASAQAYSQGFAFYAKLLKKMKIDGSETLEEFAGYVPKKAMAEKFYELVEKLGGGKLGEENVRRLITGAIMDQQPLVNKAGNPVVKFLEGEEAFIKSSSIRPVVQEYNELEKVIKEFELKGSKIKATDKKGNPTKSYLNYQTKLKAYQDQLAKLKNDIDNNVTRDTLIPAGKADVLAQAIVNAIKNSNKQGGFDFETLFRMKSGDNVSEYIATHFDNLSPELQAELSEALTANMDILTSGRLAEKIKSNENFSMKINGRETFLDEIYENHADNLFASYSNEMAGWIALAEKTGIKSKKELLEYKNALKKDIANSYDQTKAKDNFLFREENATVDAVFENIFGRSGEIDPSGIWSAVNRNLRRYNFTRVMGQVGISQLPEFGVAVSQQGWATLFNEIPMIRKLFNPKSMNIPETFIDDLRVMGAGNGDEWMSMVGRGYEITERGNYSPALFAQNNKGLGKTIENIGDKAEKGTGFLSGLLWIDSAQRRLTMKLFVNKIANNLLAEGGVDKLSKSWINRYRVIGLDVDDLRRLEKEFRNGGVVYSDTPFLGKKVLQFKFEQFKDADIARKFAIATNKYTRRAVQLNGIGDSTRIFSDTALGKTLGQFRSFVMVSWNKQFLHNVAMNDFQTYSMFMWTTFIGGLAYYGQTHFNTIGMSDSDKSDYLQKKLGTTQDEFLLKMGLASFQRAGWSSVMPPLVDMVTAQVAPNYRFNTRSSGQEMNLVTGNPTYDLLSKILTSGASVLKSTRSDYSFSQQDLNRMMRLLPFQNLYGVHQFLNFLKSNSGLPERSDYNPYSNF